MYPARNPAEDPEPEERLEMVRYIVRPDDIRKKGEKAQ